LSVGSSATIKATKKTFNQDGLNIEGDGNTINGDGCNIRGNKNKVNGDGCNVSGNKNHIKGDGCNVNGSENVVDGKGCNVNGSNNKVKFPKKRERSNGISVNTFRGGNSLVNLLNSLFGTVTSSSNSMISNVGDGGQVNTGTVGGFVVAKKKKPKVEVPEPKYVECPPPADLEHDKDGDSCCCCMVKVANCICSPCNHMKTCVECSRVLCAEGIKEVGQVKCPICKEDCTSIKRVFQ
jgi:hypothetical protein